MSIINDMTKEDVKGVPLEEEFGIHVDDLTKPGKGLGKGLGKGYTTSYRTCRYRRMISGLALLALHLFRYMNDT